MYLVTILKYMSSRPVQVHNECRGIEGKVLDADDYEQHEDLPFHLSKIQTYKLTKLGKYLITVWLYTPGGSPEQVYDLEGVEGKVFDKDDYEWNQTQHFICLKTKHTS